ncbi:glutathione S-transferase [Aureimonas sp. SA4125]|uniref:glutathione S-transferase family protein n=1 Tax=Aureimonas sp. SA4125 TaxID=2826993 RepID=UPI001CC7DE54|nr:glutathione S-transferase family protein [Aureimonas sp. SA4125]BDA83460.1 glutathione S-transferase [Aureimonas sp. SA4125]
MIEVSAFRWVPPFARGHVRDFRVRWALEEAGLPYRSKLIGPADQTSETYRAWQPFGQVPAFAEDGTALFESGAIVLHIASRSEALMPPDEVGRLRMTAWMFAALNSVEPPVAKLAEVDFFTEDEAVRRARRPAVLQEVDLRLAALSRWLEGRDYLEDRFTAADLLMTTVLRMLGHTDRLAAHPGLADYCRRCEARPAFARAMAAHLADFEEPALA